MTDPKRRAPNKHLVGILVFLVCCIGSYFIIPVQQYYRGKLEAHWDIAHGKYKGQRCVNACIALKATQEYERRIFKYANIRIETTEDCGYRMRGYNEVQWARVDRVYPGAYERAISEAVEWDRNRLQSVKE